MFRKLVPQFLAVFALAAGTAHAITFTLDDYAKIVERPATGFVDVAYTGSVTLTDGFELLGSSASSLWTAGGELADGVFPHATFALTGTMFTFRVFDTDALGHYAYGADLTSPARLTLSECPIGGGFCNNATVEYSLDIVEKAVPEPASLALLGAGLGLAAVRRRRG